MTREEMIEVGKTLLKHLSSVEWEVADLLLQVAPAGSKGVYEALRLFIEEANSDMAVKTAEGYRHTAIRWPKGKRVNGASFTSHRYLNGSPDRFEILKRGMTGSEVKRQMAKRSRLGNGSVPMTFDEALASATRHINLATRRYAGGDKGAGPKLRTQRIDRHISELNILLAETNLGSISRRTPA